MDWIDALLIFIVFMFGAGFGAAVTERENRQPEVKIYDAIGIDHLEKLVEHYEKLIEMILGDRK